MSAICTSPDGSKVYLATEETDTGNQVVVSASRSDLTTWARAYDPADGTACNVMTSPASEDRVYFYGNFGTDVGLIKHTVSSGANSDITPGSLGANEINVIDANPSIIADIVAGIDGAQDLTYSFDDGVTWTPWSATLGFDPTAVEILWSSSIFFHRVFIAGNTGSATQLPYSPNEMLTGLDLAGVLSTVANICSVIATEPAVIEEEE